MSWAEVKKINSDMGKSLDELNYELFYELAKVVNGGYGLTDGKVVIVPERTQEIDTAEYADRGMSVVILPKGLTWIGTRAFDQCVLLESILIPEGVDTIAGYAFRSCTSLKRIFLPSTIKTINSLAFTSSGLVDIYVPFEEGKIDGAPWGATNATIHYNS